MKVTNLLVFNFIRELVHAEVNFPQSWHDSKLASLSGWIYPKLDNAMTPQGCAFLGDRKFVCALSKPGGQFVRARKTKESGDLPESAALAAVDSVLQRLFLSEGQSKKWGIRFLNVPFGRLRLPLFALSSRRGRILRVCVHLLNLHTSIFGLNKIWTTYASPDVDTSIARPGYSTRVGSLLTCNQ